MKNYVHKSEYFCGNKINQYGLEHGYVDYATLAKSFDAVLNNNIIQKADDWEVVNGLDYDEETDDYKEIFQYFIISESGFQTLSDCTDELVYYSEELGIYLWCIDHLGTSWDYVLTDIKIELDKLNNEHSIINYITRCNVKIQRYSV
jgi:hypothetical protein